jgi:hypothetical protein
MRAPERLCLLRRSDTEWNADRRGVSADMPLRHRRDASPQGVTDAMACRSRQLAICSNSFAANGFRAADVPKCPSLRKVDILRLMQGFTQQQVVSIMAIPEH